MEKKLNKLGKDGPFVSALGLGCMGMSGIYGETSEDERILTIQAALDKIFPSWSDSGRQIRQRADGNGEWLKDEKVALI